MSVDGCNLDTNPDKVVLFIHDHESLGLMIHLVHASPVEYLTRTDGDMYDREHYYENPSLYESNSATKVQEHLLVHIDPSLSSHARLHLILLSPLMESAGCQDFHVS